ncbi:MAG: hypothetical protein ACI9R3_002154 [Verrucomicrobiales bacterium]|jgi:hypothetical protein
MKLLLLIPLFLCCAGNLLAADQLTPASAPALKELIGPTAEEQNWLQIPWETDLNTALDKARSTQRPIFLWEMDGHPLGCT